MATSNRVGRIVLPVFVLLMALTAPTSAATGCDLNFPNSDVPRLYRESTSYKTRYITLSDAELKNIVARLGEANRPLYDPLNVPYTLYVTFTGSKKVGYVHGVNQKGQYGGIQVFVGLDLEGRIKSFYIQKITGKWAGKFRSAEFGKQFIGLSLKDFETFDTAKGQGTGKVAAIHNLAPEAATDFYGVLRAMKKNLILMDEVVYSNKRKDND